MKYILNAVIILIIVNSYSILYSNNNDNWTRVFQNDLFEVSLSYAFL